MASTRAGLLFASTTVVALLLVLGHPLTSAPAVAGLLALSSRRPPKRRLAGLRIRSEHGSILVEVMIGTLLLALTTTAVLNGMDGAQDTGRRNKDRSVSATLAQQDLERMRSMPPSVLANLSQVRTVTVASVGYTVTSKTEWVRDASGLVSCTSDETEAEYLRLSSTVKAPASPNAPVTATSLLTPPPGIFGDDTGTAAVKLTDRDGEPLSGVTVDLEGPGSESGTTNELGCAIFAFIAADDWTAEVDGGLITWDGEVPAQSEVTVAAGKTSLTQLEIDTPSSIRASFVTPGDVSTQYHSLSVANAKLANAFKAFPSIVSSTSKDITGLFPFHDGYGAYAGTCEANNPANWDGHEDYYEDSGYGFVAPEPGELLEPVEVVVPQLHVTAKRSDSTTFAQVRVSVDEIDDDFDCEAVVYDSQAISGSYTSYTLDIPVPFGNYAVCAAIRQTSNGTWRRKYTGTSGMPANRNLTPGQTLDQSITMNVPTSGSSGQCPS